MPDEVYTYNYSKEIVPKINDYRLKCALKKAESFLTLPAIFSFYYLLG